MSTIAGLLQSFAKYMALSGFGSASHWGAYQAKEPKNIFKR